ncbi:quinolinate synthase NadA [Gulosibacter molinativorax]|uniref:Quinolinate synthase n=1 Tax=Gulosibacter molinativorax TaxID=256821 RepID=A0ABT7C4C5_9MICO|nr:quinolinate synthase NadA [Gulosibacter molinativorax]MDJ1370068.1 quinolinate synthase NadA [Gulosibacter molinativorax]QUY63739.1 Quinolinate synthase A [Gulosibacter molinativorax]
MSHTATTENKASVAQNIGRIARKQSNQSACGTDLAEPTWDFDRIPGYGPGASARDIIPLNAPTQGTLPAEYREASDEELHQRIQAAKDTLQDKLVILGHFYQRDEVVQLADYVGDSFQLAKAALAHPDAEAIVFCGVHFMAETADMLSNPNQHVILPNLAAGCSMADMANIDQVEDAWEQLVEIYGDEADAEGRVPLVPVTYMNSSAAIKAFCGRNGGIVCTSSNASTVLEWAFERGQRVIFFPDQHLGRNTAKAMGISLEDMPLWRPNLPLGGNTEDALERAKVILWNGFCSVHKRFTVKQIEQAREQYPDVRVIVHPECPMDVVDAADESGSTDYIRKAVEAAPAGSTIAIGTEINLVQRLAAEYPQHTIFCLDDVVCPCSTMYRIHPGYLAWVLEGLVAGEVRNRISVDAAVAEPARVALERMLAALPAVRS